jgi:CHASE1-domain containing sensor protein/two-component sensor histidine kinase
LPEPPDSYGDVAAVRHNPRKPNGDEVHWFARARPYLPTVLILVLLLSATATATIAALATAANRTKVHFDDRVTALEALLTDAMRSYQQALRAAVAAVNAMPGITREQWRTLVRDLAVEDYYPGNRGIGYIKRLSRDEIDAFVEAQRRDGRPDFHLRPEGERDNYTAIVYLEPEDWRNRRAIGYDMLTEPRRREAMEEARDTGRPTLSRKLTLSQETGVDIQPGIAVFTPIYVGGVTPDSVEARRAGLIGYVYSAFRMKDFLERVLATNMPDAFQKLRISIFDGKGTAHADLLFDDQMLSPDIAARPSADATRSRFRDRRTINVAGRDWTIVARSQPALEATVDRTLAWMTALGGGLISFLIASIVAQLAYAGERNARAEARLSAEVAERQRAEEEAKLANRELIHRVKNMFAIVTAIASQTARYSPTIEQFNTSFRDRLTALARVHDLLRPEPTHTPDLENFVREILKPFYGERQDALAVDGPRVAVTRQEAVLLSLLINELGTNATKYGAWAVPEGKVAVEWQPVENGENHELKIVWQESGGPAVSEPSTTGFGTNVMKFAIERGLRGRIVTSFEEAGIRHEIHLPRDGASEDDDGAGGLVPDA